MGALANQNLFPLLPLQQDGKCKKPKGKHKVVLLGFSRIKRFHSVAYLQQIRCFEVVGEIDFSFPVLTYSLYFRIHLGRFYKRFGRRACSTEHVHGWDQKPVRFQLSTSNGQHSLSQCSLGEPGSWVLYHAGNFVVSKPDRTIKLKFSMAQIDCTHTKGGLCVDSAFIYPKGFQQERMVRSQKCRC
ncbi:F-box protein PP2-A12-like [Oryza glaberrima]|uniref:F-box protein PP2-A12-like n=1 Tax=Oryza glaberrima TaxID=4538 RepID=UPI00224C2AF1|nr:F-box protein PP2-A12-like [Oryza glaberrima]